MEIDIKRYARVEKVLCAFVCACVPVCVPMCVLVCVCLCLITLVLVLGDDHRLLM